MYICRDRHGFMEYAYNGDHFIQHFFINKIKFLNSCNFLIKIVMFCSPKQGVARIKEFHETPMIQ